MSQKCSYNELRNKYGCFFTPMAVVKINGTEVINSTTHTITELLIKLMLEGTSTVMFKLADLYDVESHKFDRKTMSYLKLGAVIEIEIGYLSETTSVFKGYIDSIGCEFPEDDTPVVTVFCMDARRLMMTSGRKCITHEVKSYSEAVNAVMSPYSKLCSVEIDSTDDKLIDPVPQNSNDYNFITQELLRHGKADREFFILANKAYFREPCKNKTPVTTLEFGRELLDFRMFSSYIDLSVEVSGYDPVKGEKIYSKQAVKSDDSNQMSVMTTSPKLSYIDPDADTVQKAKIRAESIARKELDKVQKAEGITVGLPEIVPGRYIEVSDLEKMANKKYYVTEVTHRIDSDSFSTSFEAGGWL